MQIENATYCPIFAILLKHAKKMDIRFITKQVVEAETWDRVKFMSTCSYMSALMST